MKKNVSGQNVQAQLTSKTDGSDVTSGTTTVYVTGDAGTQATGTVGSGAATHEGNGVWSYSPSQAETNFDLVTFTFVNSSACSASIHIYTSFPQTGDSFARLGAPAGASVSADVAAVKTQTAAIETDTQDLQGRLPAALVSGRIDASVGAMASGVLTATAIAADAITAAKIASDVTTELQSGLATASALSTVDTNVSAIKAKTDNLPSDPADASVVAGLIAAVEAKVDIIDTNVDAVLVDTGTTLDGKINTIDTVVDAIKAVTDLLPDAGALTSLATAAALATVDSNVDAILDDTGTSGVVLTASERNAVADALLDRANAIETGITLRTAIRVIGASASGILAGAATTTVTVTGLDMSTNRITATVDADGNRSAVTLA